LLNKEDCDNLDRLLCFVKSSGEYARVNFAYDVELGWAVSIYDNNGNEVSFSRSNGQPYYYSFTIERLGKVCNDNIAVLVQKKLEG
jgi:hypothetical protein